MRVRKPEKAMEGFVQSHFSAREGNVDINLFAFGRSAYLVVDYGEGAFCFNGRKGLRKMARAILKNVKP